MYNKKCLLTEGKLFYLPLSMAKLESNGDYQSMQIMSAILLSSGLLSAHFGNTLALWNALGTPKYSVGMVVDVGKPLIYPWTAGVSPMHCTYSLLLGQDLVLLNLCRFVCTQWSMRRKINNWKMIKASGKKTIFLFYYTNAKTIRFKPDWLDLDKYHSFQRTPTFLKLFSIVKIY